MALSTPPFGTYPNVTGVVDATAQTEIAALLDEYKLRIPDGTPGTSPVPSPDFDPLRPSNGEGLQGELDGLAAAIAAAPAV